MKRLNQTLKLLLLNINNEQIETVCDMTKIKINCYSNPLNNHA